MACGADGYLLKNESPDEMSTAIRAVYAGRSYLSSSILKTGRTPSSLHSAGHVNNYEVSFKSLTAREREILQLIAESYSHRQIAELLHISVRTVDTHRFNIIQKLGLHDTASLITYAIRTGIVILQE
jgi:DNA-binding NarL/FixJ family response regulator